MSMLALVDMLMQGLLLGGMYALFATGLSLAFGIMRFVNIAHGDFIVLGAYAMLAAGWVLPVSPFMTMLLVLPLMAVGGYLAQRHLFNRVISREPMPVLLLTFGLSVMLQNGLLQMFSGDSQRLDGGRLISASISLTDGLSIGVFPLLVLMLAVGLLLGLQWMFSHTRLGRILRATSDDPGVVQLMGVNSKKVYAIAMAIASACVALSGAVLGMSKAFDPMLGPPQLLFAFEAVIIGGLGSLWGTLAGGIILGVAQTIGFRLDSGWGILSGHLVFLLILLLRPNGLFPKTRDA